MKIFIFCTESFNFDQTYLNTSSKTQNVEELSQGLLNRWTSQYDWGITTGGLISNLKNSLDHCKTFRKYLFRHDKGKNLANFDISNALGEN